jgi:NitT/TauT family transport system permease protein
VQELLYLRLPAALPYVLTGAQISASLAIIGAVTGEIFAGSVTGGQGGLGYQVILLRAEGETAGMVAAGLLACVLGFLFVGSVHLLRWRLLHEWHESFARPGRE